MCGILIFYSKNKVINSNIFKNSLELQKHRGPDHSGIIKISDKMIFGNVRLSITDLSSNSNQPMTSDYTSNVISFNGDIYNHIELKENLEKKGINFFSKGDTEVLLKYGAKKVYAIDVGQNQLHEKLKADYRVRDLSGLDVRKLDHLDLPKPEWIVADLSFISLAKALPRIMKRASLGANMICLIQPQFDLSKKDIGKNGVVKNEALRKSAVKNVVNFFSQENWKVMEITSSPILGRSGNMEFLLLAKKY